ncbi:MAG: hypothetical protein ACM3Q4_14280 [Acidobacteriota bacterium]
MPRRRVMRLQQWLDYELSTSVLILLQTLWKVTIIVAAVAAVVFTPFMLSVLWHERRWGWIVSFFMVVVIPFVIALLGASAKYAFILWLIPLGTFYLYCGALRLSIGSWDD